MKALLQPGSNGRVLYRLKSAFLSIGLQPPVVFFVFFSLLFGMLILVVTPPFQAPDEASHFFRAWQVSQGNFLHGSLYGKIPGDLHAADQAFYYLRFQPHRKTSAEYIMNNLGDSPRGRQEEVDYFNPAFVYHPVSYLPSGMGVAFAAWLNLPPLVSSYMARLLNLITYTVIIATALILLPALKWEMAFIALLPMSLFQGASVSADSMNIALNLLMLGSLLRIMLKNQTTRLDWDVLAVGTFLVACVRPIYALSSLMAFFYRKKYPGTHFYLRFGIPLLAMFLLAISWLFVNPSPAVPMTGHNPEVVMRRLIDQPILALYVPFDTLRNFSVPFFLGFVGVLGWLDVHLPQGLYVAYLVFFLMIVFGMCSVEKPVSRWIRLLALALLFLYSSSMILALYVLWPGFSKTAAGGVQGRYFLPMAPLLLIIFQKPIVPNNRCKCFGKLQKLAKTNGPLILATGAFFGLTLTVSALIARYYPTEIDVYVPTIAQTKADDICGEIVDGVVVEQSFKALGSSIDSIKLLLASFVRVNRGSLMLDIIDNEGVSITEKPIEINMKTIRKNPWLSFVCEPIKVTPGETYRLHVTSPRSQSGNAVTWFKSRTDIYPDGCAFIGGEPQAGDMAFIIQFSNL